MQHMSHFSDAADLYVPVFVILGVTVGAVVGVAVTVDDILVESCKRNEFLSGLEGERARQSSASSRTAPATRLAAVPDEKRDET